MRVEQLLVGHMLNFSYMLWSEERVAFVIDVSFGAKELYSKLRELNLKLKYIFSTHHHFDHNMGNDELASLTGALIVAHEASPIKKDIAVVDGQTLDAPGLKLGVIHTPGHTQDSVCYVSEGRVFTGDTLFVGECGRVDLPGGSAEQMYHTLFDKLSRLPDDTIVYPGHNYGATPYTTIGYEKKNNYVLKPRSLQEFLEFMATP
ncbi:MAG: MBL fold metallo-hydrolase [Thermoprotei archaeon]